MVLPPEDMVLISGRIVKCLQYIREILYFVPYGLKYSLYRSNPLKDIYMPNASVPWIVSVTIILVISFDV